MPADSAGQATGCVCTQAGFCARHQCHKTPHWHQLCRTRADYFRLWEEWRGPGQATTNGPNLLQKAANYGRAVVRHVATGRKPVDGETFAARIALCESCESLDSVRRVCQQKSCGCYVDRKARWASEDCPLGKWPQVESDQSAGEDNDSRPSS